MAEADGMVVLVARVAMKEATAAVEREDWVAMEAASREVAA